MQFHMQCVFRGKTHGLQVATQTTIHTQTETEKIRLFFTGNRLLTIVFW